MQGKVALVTGGAQGIGYAVAEGAARAGARAIAIVDRDTTRGAAAADALAALGVESAFIAADLEDPSAPHRAFGAALDRFGHVDVLANCAGITDRGSVASADAALWDRLFAINARAPFLLMQSLIKHLGARHEGGAIVNILSMHAHGGSPELAIYGASKAALAALTRNAANAHRFERIRVNGINVGWVDTPGERDMQARVLGRGESWLAEAAAQQPFGRLLSPEDVARLALYLLSQASEPMTGALIDQEQDVLGGL